MVLLSNLVYTLLLLRTLASCERDKKKHTQMKFFLSQEFVYQIVFIQHIVNNPVQLEKIKVSKYIESSNSLSKVVFSFARMCVADMYYMDVYTMGEAWPNISGKKSVVRQIICSSEFWIESFKGWNIEKCSVGHTRVYWDPIRFWHEWVLAQDNWGLFRVLLSIYSLLSLELRDGEVAWILRQIFSHSTTRN